MNNVTLQDVAQAAGVSLATVSRALHGGYVSAEKRRRIEEAVHTLRYIPNQSAAALKRNRSRTIGHLMHFHDNLLASRVNAGLARAAHERGYSLFSVTSNGGGEDSRRMAEELISRRMDGMVVTSCRELPAETTAHLAEVGIPTVLIERWAPGAMGDRIRIDDVAAPWPNAWPPGESASPLSAAEISPRRWSGSACGAIGKPWKVPACRRKSGSFA